MENKDLKFLKRHYGENFAHLCRRLFPTLLQQEGLVSKIISDRFGPSRSLYEDVLPVLEDFKAYIYGFADVEKEKPVMRQTKTPQQIMDEAGYILFPECKTEEDVQAFKKYYAEGEKLCTFWGGRLNYCRVWFAVKKNVSQIKRKNFPHPQRQDEYGTSVISIQFSRGNNSTVSIKNRYNHTVSNPDATFDNNLDNIAAGLEQAFMDTYHIPLLGGKFTAFQLPNYRLGDDGRFYKVNLELNDFCFCENNVYLRHGEVKKFDKARYILAENYAFDKQKNKVFPILRYEDDDTFVESLGDLSSISTKQDDNKNTVIVVTPTEGEDVEITLNKSNSIIAYTNPNLHKIQGQFSLPTLHHLKTFCAPNLEEIGYSFLDSNNTLTTFQAEKLKSVGNCFLGFNEKLTSFYAPNLKKTGYLFLEKNNVMTSFRADSLESVGDCFMDRNTVLTSFYAPKLKSVGACFMTCNNSMKTFSAPSLENIEDDFMTQNKTLTSFEAPNLKNIGRLFLPHNRILSNFYAPNLRSVGHNFLHNCVALKNFSAPSLEEMGEYSLSPTLLKSFYAPKMDCNCLAPHLRFAWKNTSENFVNSEKESVGGGKTQGAVTDSGKAQGVVTDCGKAQGGMEK